MSGLTWYHILLRVSNSFIIIIRGIQDVSLFRNAVLNSNDRKTHTITFLNLNSLDHTVMFDFY
ncbi:unnamed protein product, partial [Schistosoma rodhaini]|uniref:Uncharacterized protein n=1 Tax=Schistosoma rodhaini TaxID=6188 RepID=A0AA85FXX5_9TREM